MVVLSGVMMMVPVCTAYRSKRMIVSEEEFYEEEIEGFYDSKTDIDGRVEVM